jgi:peptidoglycan-N-acetylglucosamine deacetylase
MKIVTTPFLVKKLYPSLTWHFPRKEKKIYFTFDDGPVPEITPWVLDQLAAYQAKATFFCLGKNVEKYPELYRRILAEGHTVGNHTHTHLNGWKCANDDYYQDIEVAKTTISSSLFRPPYGKLRKSQIRDLRKKYRIVMWDVLSYDFDTSLSPRKCSSYVLKNAKNGSVVVFHDSLKAKQNLTGMLPLLLQKYAAAGFTFCSIRQ